MKKLIIACALGTALVLSTTTAMADADDAGYFLLGTLFGSAITQPAYGYQEYYPDRVIIHSDYYGGGYYHRGGYYHHYRYRYDRPYFRSWHRSWRGDSWRGRNEGYRSYRRGHYHGWGRHYGDRDGHRDRGDHRGHRWHRGHGHGH